MTDPTPPQDISNHAYRAAVAAKDQAEFEAARVLAEQAFGEGWVPRGFHYLTDKLDAERCRLTGEKPPVAAVVVTCTRLGETRNFRILDGKPVPCRDMEDGFGDMLTEPHPTMRREWGVPRRYDVCWSAYFPETRVQTPDALAVARDKRVKKKVAKQEATDQEAFAAEQKDSLFADLIREEGPVRRKGRGR